MNKIETNYIGEYDGLYDFISQNELQDEFIERYKSEYPDIERDWESFCRGEIDADSLLIEEFLDDTYFMFYIGCMDKFIVVKRDELCSAIYHEF